MPACPHASSCRRSAPEHPLPVRSRGTQFLRPPSSGGQIPLAPECPANTRNHIPPASLPHFRTCSVFARSRCLYSQRRPLVGQHFSQILVNHAPALAASFATQGLATHT